MKVLYLSYWGYNEGLTKASVIPHVKVLACLPTIEEVVLCTIERNGRAKEIPSISKVTFVPFHSRNIPINIFNKISDFLFFRRNLKNLLKIGRIDIIIARSSLSGLLVYKLSKKLNIPLVIESFEPHSEYMREAGVWHPWGLKYIFLNRAEREMARIATSLVTVSSHFAKNLETAFAKKKIATFPCAVDHQLFAYSSSRSESRKEATSYTR